MMRCPMPWGGVAVDPDGLVKNCAMNRDNLGYLKDIPIREILDGDKNKSIRDTMRKGIWPGSCKSCEFRESIDPEFSNRAYQLRIHQHLGDDIYTSDTHHLTHLDLRWSNTCNFACVYCSPQFSSLWASELGKNINANKENINQLIEYAIENADNIVEIYLAGGEPLMIKENIGFLSKLHDLNPDINIRITTNLSKLDTGVYEQIIKFKKIHWEISLEALGQEFEYIRYPGSWQEIEKNLIRLLDEHSNDSINITMNYLLLNCMSIIETGLHLIDLGVNENQIAVHYLTDPNFLDARNINQKNIFRLISYLNSYTRSGTTFGTSLLNCAEFIKKPFDKKPVSVVNLLDNLDHRRKLDFRKVFPHILEMIL